MEFFLAYLVPILTSTVYMATPLIFASVGGAKANSLIQPSTFLSAST